MDHQTVIRRQNDIEYNELRKKLESGEIFYWEFNSKAWKYYTVQEKNEFAFRDLDHKKSMIAQLSSKFPNNRLIRDIQYRYIIPEELRGDKILQKKKEEYIQLFHWYSKDRYGQELSLIDILKYYKSPESESAGEWDFINDNDRIVVEVTNATMAGSKLKEIQKEFNTDVVGHVYTSEEVLDEAKNIIRRKLRKKGKENFFHRIIVNISAYDDSRFSFFEQLTNGAEFRNPKKYWDFINELSETEYANFEYGEIIFVFGLMYSKIAKFSVKGYWIDPTIIKEENSCVILSSSLENRDFYDFPDGKILIERLRKNFTKK